MLTNVSKLRIFNKNEAMIEGQYFYYPHKNSKATIRQYRAFVKENQCDSILDITDRHRPITVDKYLRSIFVDRYDYVDRIISDMTSQILNDVYDCIHRK